MSPDVTRIQPAAPPPRPGAPFTLTVQPDRETIRLVLGGELDLACVGELRQQLDELADAGFAHIVVDLSALEFVDSSGVHALLDGHARAVAENWRLTLIPGPPAVQRVFEITETHTILPFSRDGQRFGR